MKLLERVRLERACRNMHGAIAMGIKAVVRDEGAARVWGCLGAYTGHLRNEEWKRLTAAAMPNHNVRDPLDPMPYFADNISTSTMMMSVSLWDAPFVFGFVSVLTGHADVEIWNVTTAELFGDDFDRNTAAAMMIAGQLRANGHDPVMSPANLSTHLPPAP